MSQKMDFKFLFFITSDFPQMKNRKSRESPESRESRVKCTPCQVQNESRKNQPIVVALIVIYLFK